MELSRESELTYWPRGPGFSTWVQRMFWPEDYHLVQTEEALDLTMADSPDTEPTNQGLRRYSATAGYNTELASPIPCLCHDGCQSRCAGECGCEACSVQFSMFCDEAGIYGLDAELSTTEEEALASYRGVADTSPQAIIHRRRFDGR